MRKLESTTNFGNLYTPGGPTVRRKTTNRLEQMISQELLQKPENFWCYLVYRSLYFLPEEAFAQGVSLDNITTIGDSQFLEKILNKLSERAEPWSESR